MLQRPRHNVMCGFAAGVGGGLLAGLLVVIQPPVFAQRDPQIDKVFRAEKLELVDHEGRVRAAFGLGPNGDPALALFDAKGTPRAGLSLWSGGDPVFELYNKEGKTRATVGYTELQHGITPEERGDGQPIFSMLLFDEKGEIVWRAP